MSDKIDNLKFILTRLDSYIESSQNKSNLYLVLNTVVLGGVITIISVLNDLNCNQSQNSLLLLIAIASIISILITLLAIKPYTETSIKKKSVYFFADIAKCTSLEQYQKLFNKSSDGDLANDISAQIYSISIGLNRKYKRLRIVGFIIAGEFFLLSIWIVTLLNKLITIPKIV